MDLCTQILNKTTQAHNTREATPAGVWSMRGHIFQAQISQPVSIVRDTPNSNAHRKKYITSTKRKDKNVKIIYKDGDYATVTSLDIRTQMTPAGTTLTLAEGHT